MSSFLKIASNKKQDEIVQFLIKKDADVNIGSPLSEAIAEGSKSTAEILLKKGANPNFVYDKGIGKGMSPLSYTIEKDTSLTELLLKYGANPNAKSKEEKSLLETAAEQENIDAIKILLQYGVSPEVNDYSLTPGSDIYALLKLESAFRIKDISFNTINSHPIVKMNIEAFGKDSPFLSDKLIITNSQIEEFVKWKVKILSSVETLNEYTKSYAKNLILLYEFCKTDANLLKSPVVKLLEAGLSKCVGSKDIAAIKYPILTLKNMIVSKISDLIKDEEYKDYINILEEGLTTCVIPLSGVHYEKIEG